MPKYLLVGVSEAQTGRDAEHSDWYDAIHIPDICALPGVSSGKRFTATPFGLTPPPGRHLATYEIETDDIEALIGEMRRRSAAGEIRMSDSIDLATTDLWVYQLA